MTAPSNKQRSRSNPEIRARIDAAATAMVRPVAAAVAMMLLVLALADLYILPSSVAYTLSMVSAASCAVLGLLWLRIRRVPPPRWQHAAALVVGAVLLTDVVVYMRFLDTALPSAILMLVLLGSGIVFVSDLWFGVFLVSCVLAWALSLPASTPEEVVVYYTLGLMAATVASAALHGAWVGRLVDLAELREKERRSHTVALEAAGRLAAGVAHDFNNLLTAVTGYADLILASVVADDPIRADLDEIVRASANGRRLTDQLLALGRHQVLMPRVLDVNELVRDTSVELRDALSADVDLVVDLGPERLPAEIDAASFREILWNVALSTPSAEAGEGGITIRAALHGTSGLPNQTPAARGGSYVHVTIEDPLADLSPEELERAFTFPRGPVARPDRVARAMAKGLVRQGRGFAFARAEPGGGTSFHVCFPSETTDSDAARRTMGDGRAGPESAGRGESILVVEDEDVVRRLAERLLADLGYAVTTAADGPEALRRAEARTEPFDLVLSDVVMPGMSGSEVVRRLEEKGAARRVVFMSGYAEDQVVQRAIQERSVPFIAKPFTPGALAREIRRVLDAG